MPFAARKGTPFPIVLNASDNETSSGITNVAGSDCIAKASATDILRGKYGCMWTSLFPYAAVGEYRQR